MIYNENAMTELLEARRRFVREIAIPNEERTELEDRVPDEVVVAMRAWHRWLVDPIGLRVPLNLG